MGYNNKNIKSLKDCYGCGMCAVSCPPKIISIKRNTNGFFEPHIINDNMCVGCGLCLKVCAFNDKALSVDNSPIGSYAAWSNDSKTRKACSSGGVMYEIGKYMLDKAYYICAVKYDNETKQAIHYIASNEIELRESRGSKYLQSYSVEALKALDFNRKVVFVGTPCQVDSLRRYVRIRNKEDNVLFVDFFCHGVPSYNVWKAYCDIIEKDCGNILDVSWRDKENGWHDSWRMRIKGEIKSIVSSLSGGDIFYKIFLSDTCLNKACYKNCKYKYNKSAADIRIGDMWGYTYNKNEEGVSAVVCFTPQGADVISHTNCQIVEHLFEEVAEGQMKKSPKYNLFVNYVQRLVSNEASLHRIAKLCGLYISYNNMVYLFSHPAYFRRKIKNYIYK